MSKRENKRWEVEVWFDATAADSEEAINILKKRLSRFGLFDGIDYRILDQCAFEVEESRAI
jgi:hypothetical protein